MPFVENKIKETKIFERPNKNNVSVNAIEKSHFSHSEVNSDVKFNEALDTILKTNCHESGNKVLSIKTASYNQKFVEKADYGSEPEEENERNFRKVYNAIIVMEELIRDYVIPVIANRLNDSSQKEPNIDSSETEMSNESHSSSMNG
ncbi:hypothetical protein AVEN_202175-1 [Araneus ventricosus]|uniref:Uncharacterized protein n=1 Tax=Araneus ventricosus TaxID=182803 RepID=A0A4Y2FHS7_ARAVE|nr:hypothetical protein AVEN_202175-1 [Araneus ventricosus]